MIYRGALDAVHLVKDLFLLAFDHYADLFSESSQFICHVTKRLLHLIGVNDHHHIEISLYDGLGNIQDIDAVLRKIGTYLCDNAYCVLTNYRNNCFFIIALIFRMISCYYFYLYFYLLNYTLLHFATLCSFAERQSMSKVSHEVT